MLLRPLVRFRRLSIAGVDRVRNDIYVRNDGRGGDLLSVDTSGIIVYTTCRDRGLSGHVFSYHGVHNRLS